MEWGGGVWRGRREEDASGLLHRSFSPPHPVFFICSPPAGPYPSGAGLDLGGVTTCTVGSTPPCERSPGPCAVCHLRHQGGERAWPVTSARVRAMAEEEEGEEEEEEEEVGNKRADEFLKDTDGKSNSLEIAFCPRSPCAGARSVRPTNHYTRLFTGSRVQRWCDGVRDVSH